MTIGMYIKCLFLYPRLTLSISKKWLRNRWLDFKIWKLERKKRRLQMEVAALKAKLGVLSPDR